MIASIADHCLDVEDLPPRTRGANVSVIVALVEEQAQHLLKEAPVGDTDGALLLVKNSRAPDHQPKL